MSDWISVKERLPEECDSYLCALEAHCGSAEIVILCWAPWPDCQGWYVRDKKDNVRLYKGSPVTHWMPLPDPPEEGC